MEYIYEMTFDDNWKITFENVDNIQRHVELALSDVPDDFEVKMTIKRTPKKDQR